MHQKITLRPLVESDQPFVFRVFAGARARQFANTGLADDQLRQLMEMQHRAQQSQYRAQYPDADFDLVLVDELPAGYLYVHRGADRLVLLDIALLQDQCGRGIGGQLVSALIRESEQTGRPILAHVEKQNRAWRLWQRLGFRIVDDNGVYLGIEYTSPGITMD
ncbi:MAG: GNAT family N-acetyltransferase [Gammaproteobacteria bacterium]|nr:GNAT family N-acetyltransferase [Gammaproteobacteria bacterium]